MTVATDPALAFQRIAGRILDAVQAALDHTPAGRVGRAAIAAGTADNAAWDACDCDGLLLLTINRHYGTHAFPDDTASALTVGPTGGGIIASNILPWAADLAAEISVQLLRCAAVPPDGSIAVAPAVLTAESERAQRDAYTVRTAVICLLDGMVQAGEIEDYEVRDQPPLGPQGGCVGTQLNTVVSVPFLCPCP
jgi:hypothetical protein